MIKRRLSASTPSHIVLEGTAGRHKNDAIDDAIVTAVRENMIVHLMWNGTRLIFDPDALRDCTAK